MVFLWQLTKEKEKAWPVALNLKLRHQLSTYSLATTTNFLWVCSNKKKRLRGGEKGAYVPKMNACISAQQETV